MVGSFVSVTSKSVEDNTGWLGGGFKDFYVHPYLGKWSNLTNIFQMGWNHQLDDVCQVYPRPNERMWYHCIFLYWTVQSDEQTSNGWPFSLLNDGQMSNKVGVEHQPVYLMLFWSLICILMLYRYISLISWIRLLTRYASCICILTRCICIRIHLQVRTRCTRTHLQSGQNKWQNTSQGILSIICLVTFWFKAYWVSFGDMLTTCCVGSSMCSGFVVAVPAVVCCCLCCWMQLLTFVVDDFRSPSTPHVHMGCPLELPGPPQHPRLRKSGIRPREPLQRDE